MAGRGFRPPDYLIEPYKGLKNDLPAFNDDPSWTLPMPARYVIGQDGTILCADVNPDRTHRMACLRQLMKKIETKPRAYQARPPHSRPVHRVRIPLAPPIACTAVSDGVHPHPKMPQ